MSMFVCVVMMVALFGALIAVDAADLRGAKRVPVAVFACLLTFVLGVTARELAEEAEGYEFEATVDLLLLVLLCLGWGGLILTFPASRSPGEGTAGAGSLTAEGSEEGARPAGRGRASAGMQRPWTREEAVVGDGAGGGER